MTITFTQVHRDAVATMDEYLYLRSTYTRPLNIASISFKTNGDVANICVRRIPPNGGTITVFKAESTQFTISGGGALDCLHSI